MMTTASAGTGLGLSPPLPPPAKLINNFSGQIPRWMKSPNQSSSSSRIIKMSAFVYQNHKAQVSFNNAKGTHNFSFRGNTNQGFQNMQCKSFSSLNHSILPIANQLQIEAITSSGEPHFAGDMPNAASTLMQELFLIDLDAATAKTLITFLGPFLSAFGFLFILRIVMSWYPKLPVQKFPYVIAYAPTEPLLAPTRKLIPPLAGVDVTPVVWFGLLSFLNEILVGPQGLLVLLSQQV